MNEARRVDRRILATGLAGTLMLGALCHFGTRTEGEMANPGYVPTRLQVRYSASQIYEGIRSSASEVSKYARIILTGDEF